MKLREQETLRSFREMQEAVTDLNHCWQVQNLHNPTELYTTLLIFTLLNFTLFFYTIKLCPNSLNATEFRSVFVLHCIVIVIFIC